MGINKETLANSINMFIDWLNDYGDYSFDKDDILDSKYGVLMKCFFYKHKVIGAPIATALLLQETFIPSIVKYLCEKRREAIAEAHYAAGFLNLYDYYGKEEHLKNAANRLEYLKNTSISEYSGYCWGYSKGWQTPYGYWPAGTPCITTTPYVYWAFKKYYLLTGDISSRNVLKSIADFVLNDLKNIQMPNGTFSSQYSTLDTDGSFVNSTSYRCALLYDAWTTFDDEKYKIDADNNLCFILSYQKEDGSWPYHVINEQKAMIDNFHTCFILKNLFTAYKITGNNLIYEALRKGLDYYKKELLFSDKRPKHVSKATFIKLRKYEMYDYAEGINLGVLVKDFFPEYYNIALILANDLIANFQLKDGHFVTRITILGTRHKLPYHRWPQAQLFNALTLLLNNL
jgi:hypothetical protein